MPPGCHVSDMCLWEGASADPGHTGEIPSLGFGGNSLVLLRRVGGVLLPGLPRLSGFILTLAISLVINSLTNPRFNLRSDERGLSAECLTKEAETIISEKYEEIKDTVQVCECVSVCVCVSV